MIQFSGDFLQCLLSFAKTAELGSQTLAGRELGRSQSALSQQIGKLESTLGLTSQGFALFERQRGRYALTEQGERLLALYREMEHVLERMTTLGGGETELRLAVVYALEHQWLPGLLRQVELANPAWRVTHQTRYYNEVVDAVQNGTADCGLVMRVPFPADVHFEPLFFSSYYLFSAKHGPYALPRKVTRKFLESCDMVLGPEKAHLSMMMQGFFVPSEYSRTHLRTSGAELVRANVLHGRGYGLMDGLAIGTDTRLARRSLSHLTPDREYGLLLRSGVMLSPALAELLALTRHYAGE